MTLQRTRKYTYVHRISTHISTVFFFFIRVTYGKRDKPYGIRHDYRDTKDASESEKLDVAIAFVAIAFLSKMFSLHQIRWFPAKPRFTLFCNCFEIDLENSDKTTWNNGIFKYAQIRLVGIRLANKLCRLTTERHEMCKHAKYIWKQSRRDCFFSWVFQSYFLACY